MNILYLCTYYHRAMIFYDAMNYLRARGNGVFAFNASAIGEPIAEKFKPIMDENVLHCECYRRWHRYLYFYKQNRIYDSLCKKVNLKNYHLIHSHMLMNGGYVAYKTKINYGIPYVVSIRSGDVNFFLRLFFFRFVAKRIIKNSSGILFLSYSYKNQFCKLFKKMQKEILEKSVVVPNGIEDFWLHNMGKPKHLQDDNIINVLTVGKIDKNKNMVTVMKACRILTKRGYKVKLTVVGQVFNKTIEKKLKNDSNTEVIPFLKKEELLDLYRNRDVFVLPSFKETFGRAYVESMTQGTPVIYSKNQGFDGFFDSGDVGYSVNPKNALEIADCIVSICNNYASMSENCIKKAGFFDWSTLSERLEDFYAESIKR